MTSADAISIPPSKALKATAGRGWERGVEIALFLSSLLAILITLGIAFVLVSNSINFFTETSWYGFLTGTEWAPDGVPASFGVLPLVVGTLLVTIGASVLAVPLGLGTAIYLSEYASFRVRSILKPAIEVLAGIPSIVYGLFAILVISPLLQQWFGCSVFNAGNAVIVLAFMVLPIITSLSEDALRAVPHHLRHGALALGATRWEVTRQVVVPAALSGIVASVILGLSRAVGETMAVTLAAGARPSMALDLCVSHETMTSFIAFRAQGDLAHAGASYYSLFAVGLLLFGITFAFNWIAHRVKRRFAEAY
jgi:phosphate transport system permease protein